MTLIDLEDRPLRAGADGGAPATSPGGRWPTPRPGIAVLGREAPASWGPSPTTMSGRTYAENLRAAGRGVRAAPERVGRRGPAWAPAAAWCSSPTTPTGPWARTSGRPSTLSPDGRPDVLRRPGLGGAARGLPVGRAGGQGGHAARRRHRPRGGRAPSRRPCRTPSASSAISANSSICWSTTWTSCWATRRKSPCSSAPPSYKGALEVAEENGLRSWS